MQICRTIDELRSFVSELRAQGRTIGLVPTMGALHAGHMSLVATAAQENDAVVASIFVNPTQFGNPDDLLKYPRTDDADLAALKAAGVAAVLFPSVEEMYPEGDETIVETTRLANVLHGEVRPGHFRGVCTVVTKLFNIFQADRAYFGEKDYQQLQVIRQMVRDLCFATQIVGVPTVREADGLAMSSRNVRLTPEDRAAAPILNQSLDAAAQVAAQGGTVGQIDAAIRKTVTAEPRARLVAVDIVSARSLKPITGIPQSDIGIMISVEFGPEDNAILLIDQREIVK